MSARDIAAEVWALEPADRLRLAADLMEARCPHLALPIIRRTADELALAIQLYGQPPAKEEVRS